MNYRINPQRQIMNKHIPFPSITQFKDVVKQVRQNAKYHELPLPTITFSGAVKLHGTNSCIVRKVDGTVDDIYAQSRERVLSLESDNAGFNAFVLQHKNKFNSIIDMIVYDHMPRSGFVQLYGEWCGGSIQKGVGLNHLPKQFILFAVRISDDAESQNWMSPDEMKSIMGYFPSDVIRCIHDFPTFDIDIDFNNPELSQNRLVELTNAVEKDCPVSRQLLGMEFNKELVGEGIVYTAIYSSVPGFDISGIRFKVKGRLHSSSKVKTLASVDEEKMNSVKEFVDAVCTLNRLEQGITVLKEQGMEIDVKNTGFYLRWLVSDCIKEESGMMVNSGLCTKDVTSSISATGRQFWINQL